MKIDIKHYIEICKKHEETHASTNERMQYWENYKKLVEEPKPMPQSKARFEHG